MSGDEMADLAELLSAKDWKTRSGALDKLLVALEYGDPSDAQFSFVPALLPAFLKDNNAVCLGRGFSIASVFAPLPCVRPQGVPMATALVAQLGNNPSNRAKAQRLLVALACNGMASPALVAVAKQGGTKNTRQAVAVLDAGARMMSEDADDGTPAFGDRAVIAAAGALVAVLNHRDAKARTAASTLLRMAAGRSPAARSALEKAARNVGGDVQRRLKEAVEASKGSDDAKPPRGKKEPVRKETSSNRDREREREREREPSQGRKEIGAPPKSRKTSSRESSVDSMDEREREREAPKRERPTSHIARPASAKPIKSALKTGQSRKASKPGTLRREKEAEANE
ncbi:hypothetical protein KIPB_010308, partial [Kipferlia bialata]|eukprot:g10308.t1